MHSPLKKRECENPLLYPGILLGELSTAHTRAIMEMKRAVAIIGASALSYKNAQKAAPDKISPKKSP